jgi:probable HAF family extracellular repeat protein
MSLLPQPLRLLLALSAALAGVPVEAACPPDCPPYPAAYELTDLGTLGGTKSEGFGINDAGQVVGRSSLAGDAATHAFLYDHGALTDLGTLGGTSSSAKAINASGQIVGYSTLADGSLHATLWTGRMPSDLGTNGAAGSSANGINSAGQIVGYVFDGATLASSQATLWDGASIVSLPAPADGSAPSAADAITDAGQIVGFANARGSPDGPYAALWPSSADPETFLDSAGQPAEAYATTGSVSVGTALENPRPALWNGTALTYLGGVAIGAAYALNVSGAVVGTDEGAGLAILWLPQDYSSAKAAIDLNRTLRPEVAATVGLLAAQAINSAGLIVANGYAGGTLRTFLLTPAPTPAGPPAVQLSANPATVATGGTFTVSWSSSNSWSCVAEGSGGAPAWSGAQPTSGSVKLDAGASPGTINLALSCYYGNQGAAAHTTVTVSYPEVSVSLTASAASITTGESTTLTWSSQNATSCSASGGASGDGWGGPQPPASSKPVTESNAGAAAISLTYTLTCVSSVSNKSGAASATVTVMPQPSSGGGGGALELCTLLTLLAAMALRLKPVRQRSGRKIRH